MLFKKLFGRVICIPYFDFRVERINERAQLVAVLVILNHKYIYGETYQK